MKYYVLGFDETEIEIDPCCFRCSMPMAMADNGCHGQWCGVYHSVCNKQYEAKRCAAVCQRQRGRCQAGGASERPDGAAGNV